LKAAAILASVVLVLGLNVVASVRVLRSDVIAQSQKVAWLGLAWVVPLLGAILALQIAAERTRAAPVPGSYPLEDGISESSGYGPDSGAGGHGADGGHGDGGASGH